MAVGADRAHPRQHDAVLGGDDMGDALAGVIDVEQVDARFLRAVPGRLDEFAAVRHQGDIAPPGPGVHNMVDDAKRAPGGAHVPPRLFQPAQGDAAHALMQENPVDMDEAVAAAKIGGFVQIPKFVEQCRGHVVSGFRLGVPTSFRRRRSSLRVAWLRSVPASLRRLT